MSERTLVSVLLPAYNAERFIAEAIESILSQTFSNWEIIAIDDGSSDRTGAILDEYQARDSRVRAVHRRHSGLVESLNAGLSLASGEFIARQDADDISLPDRLRLQVEFLKRNRRTAAVGGALRPLWSGQSQLWRPPLDNESIQAGLGSQYVLAHPVVMFRTSTIRQVGGYRKQFEHSEDLDLFIRLGERFELANLPEPLVLYRIHNAQVGHKHTRQQALSMIGAVVCGEKRRRTGFDPADGIDLVTEAFLQQVGVTTQEIARQVVGNLVVRARFCIENADAIAASELIDSALRNERMDLIGQELLGELYFVKGKASIRSGRRMWGGGWLLKSLLLTPRFLLGAIRRRVWKVLRLESS